nr:hypothetical protein [Micromonospora sp. DSM 115978]
MNTSLARRTTIGAVLLLTLLLGAGLPATAAAQQVPRKDPLTAAGIGPYRVGSATLANLTARGLVTDVQEIEVCAGSFTARATGRYADRLLLRFQGDRLVVVSTTDPTIRTANGGGVGLTLDELEARYGARGEIVPGKWWLRAYLVSVGDRVIAFFEDPYGPTVVSVSAGERDRVLASFVGGDDQC